MIQHENTGNKHQNRFEYLSRETQTRQQKKKRENNYNQKQKAKSKKQKFLLFVCYLPYLPRLKERKKENSCEQKQKFLLFALRFRLLFALFAKAKSKIFCSLPVILKHVCFLLFARAKSK